MEDISGIAFPDQGAVRLKVAGMEPCVRNPVQGERADRCFRQYPAGAFQKFCLEIPDAVMKNQNMRFEQHRFRRFRGGALVMNFRRVMRLPCLEDFGEDFRLDRDARPCCDQCEKGGILIQSFLIS